MGTESDIELVFEVTAAQKELIEKAANLQGVSTDDFMLNAALARAKQTLEIK